MNSFEKIKRYYELGFWNEEMVYNAVIKGKITEEEYKEITKKSEEEALTQTLGPAQIIE